MAELVPFRGVWYNERTVGDLATVVTPPYDVISPLDQERYYESHRYNFIRLILGRTSRRDHARWNQYIRARRLIRDWLRRRVFKLDRGRALYLYAQEFIHHGVKVTRLGCLGLLRLEPYEIGRIMPHEHTFDEQVRDRLTLLRTTQADLSPIFTVGHDPAGVLEHAMRAGWERSEPLLQVDTEGVRHTVKRLADGAAMASLQAALVGTPLVIADGHHRYEAALRYSHEAQEAKHVTAYVMSSADPGVTILPTHRLVRSVPGSSAGVKAKLRAACDVAPCPDSKTLLAHLARRERSTDLGLLIEDQYYLLRLKDRARVRELDDAPECWRTVDAVILHEWILRRLLGLSDDQQRELITYTRDEELAANLVRQGEYTLGFYLGAPRFETIYAVAASGYRMPRKTTYFFPKLLAGLVFHLLQEPVRRSRAFSARRGRSTLHLRPA